MEKVDVQSPNKHKHKHKPQEVFRRKLPSSKAKLSQLTSDDVISKTVCDSS